MSELNFPTKLIRLTKATFTIVMCCVKIINDCFEPDKRIKTGRRIICAALQCRAGSYRTTSKPTNNRHNLQQRNTTTCNNKNKNICFRPGMKGRFGTWGKAWILATKHFKVVKEFVYLGSLMTPTNDVSLEIQLRIQTANRYCFGLR
jgi:hypothetical protein